jgi:signal transduction histidine kinase
VSLAPLAQRTADELRHELPASTAIEVRGVFGDIDGDEVLLRQVLANLLRNAAEACEGAGRVPAIVLEGGVDQAERTCRVTIADNGPGIPEALRLQVFQPFFTTRAQGTGSGFRSAPRRSATTGTRSPTRSSPTAAPTWRAGSTPRWR